MVGLQTSSMWYDYLPEGEIPIELTYPTFSYVLMGWCLYKIILTIMESILEKRKPKGAKIATSYHQCSNCNNDRWEICDPKEQDEEAINNDLFICKCTKCEDKQILRISD